MTSFPHLNIDVRELRKCVSYRLLTLSPDLLQPPPDLTQHTHTLAMRWSPAAASTKAAGEEVGRVLFTSVNSAPFLKTRIS